MIQALNTVRYRLILAAALATCAVWFGVYIQYGSLQQERQRIADVQQQLDDSVALSVLAVSLARERGRTQSVLAVDGAQERAQQDLANARAQADRALQPLGELFPSDGVFMRQLADVRRAADERRTDLDTAFATYIAIIADVNTLASRRLAGAMLKLGLPFEHVNAMRDAVERAGQFRGLVFGALASRELTPQTLMTVREDILLAEDALRRALIMAPDAAGTDLPRFGVGSSRWKSWQQEWQALLADPQGYLSKASADRWWTVATAAIDDLESALEAEERMAVGIAAEQIAEIQRKVYWAVAAMVIIGLASVAMLLVTVSRVVRGFGQLVGGIEHVTKNRDLGARLPDVGTDEFGQIGKSVNTLVATIEGLMSEREAQAELDGLTRALNRKGLDRQLAARTNPSRKTPEPFGLLVLDIDYFKKINDEFGHLQGDLVLKEVARVAMESVRPDDIVGRWGGEEFVVVLSGGTELDLSSAAEKIRVAIEATDFKLGRLVTASIGASMWRPGDNLQEAFKRADVALYQAKSSGRNRCVVA